MRGVLRGLGIILLASGLALLGWVGWQYVGTGLTANHNMAEGEKSLREQWKTPTQLKPSTGAPFALLRIPKFGAGWEKPVVQGVGQDDLARGVGHYPQTQLPSQSGNFAIAGHRVTHGSPFRKLLDLRKGDHVIVETADAVYSYTLDGSPRDLTVTPSATWVLQPVPGKPDEAPTTSTITLTTCQDLFHSPDRSVAFGHLIRVSPKS
ncbi:class E sortase [Kribbella capetownensis]|uniref:Class E sortase n=1 Tax=Kribbella capetownensis TaxID=1572659 RepID=A0A4R0JUJ7_9ACTN|nr:class E sortase [Kribbella capetownensis]TCC50659.1 class E sortase [Kribbella capetownensis]